VKATFTALEAVKVAFTATSELAAVARRLRGRRVHRGLGEDPRPAGPSLRRRGMKYVVFYEPSEDILTRGPAVMPAHRARIDEFRRRGTLLMIDTFDNPQVNGAMGLFTSREAAEEFAKDDPFVLSGVVRSWRIQEWNEVLQP
jgi:uncharacterized protein YciI